MKRRLPALDGLRGLAALAVMLSHLDHNIILLAFGPVVSAIFRTVSAGPNAVQILFVLTGFLMAYLYPVVDKPFSFIQKRYTRIFPVFILVVIYFWLISTQKLFSTPLMQIVLVGALAVAVHVIWRGIKIVDKNGRWGKSIFFGFLLLQVLMMGVLVMVVPKIALHYPQGSLVQSVINLFANMTLTMPFTTYTPRLNLVFWSLCAEVLFYLSYPFVVLPLIHIARKWGVGIGIILVVLSTKILFDIDRQLMYQGGFLVVNIARASGFIAGIVVGTMYQQQGKLWQLCEKILKKQPIGIALLVFFILMQWGDSAIRNVADPIASNYYFLIASWIIAATLIMAIIDGTIIQKIFSKKIFVFLGAISYTLYLSHSQAISWVQVLLAPLERQSVQLYAVLLVTLSTVASVALAWVLYMLVDRLYFAYHIKLPKETTVKKSKQQVVQTPRHTGIVAVVGYLIVLLAVYTGSYQLSLLVDRPWITMHQKPFSSISLLSHHIEIPFTAHHNNLSIVAMHFQYKDNAHVTSQNTNHPAQIQFTLLDSARHRLFTSESTAYLTAGADDFQFGFPPIPNAKGQQYIAVLSLKGGNTHDQVLVDTSPTNFLTMSIAPSGHTRWIYILVNRVILLLTTPASLGAVLLIPFALLPFYLRSSSVENVKKRYVYLARYFVNVIFEKV